jgi:hypothetical protein
MSSHTHTPKTIVGLLLLAAVSAAAADLPSGGTPQVSPLKSYCPIGAAGNNLKNPQFNPVAYSPELALAPLNFGPGPGNPLVSPNTRTISNVIPENRCNGQNGQTTDPQLAPGSMCSGNSSSDLDLESPSPQYRSISRDTAA